MTLGGGLFDHAMIHWVCNLPVEVASFVLLCVAWFLQLLFCRRRCMFLQSIVEGSGWFQVWWIKATLVRSSVQGITSCDHGAFLPVDRSCSVLQARWHPQTSGRSLYVARQTSGPSSPGPRIRGLAKSEAAMQPMVQSPASVQSGGSPQLPSETS